MKITFIVLLLSCSTTIFFDVVLAELRVGFYNSSCPTAESVVKQVVLRWFRVDPSITAALLRMHFHDCFVRGCDASILIDSTSETSAEKDAIPNRTVRGFSIIDEAKKALEAACPSRVSCADIITLATRDAVFLAGGPKYDVPTGRRDGLDSESAEVDLPGSSSSIFEALQLFTLKGLTLHDMVTLLGAHTVGNVHCSFFQNRISNFRTQKPDPTMDPSLVEKLLTICGKSSSRSRLKKDPKVFLDQNTSFTVDNEIYKQVLQKRGVLQIDQLLESDETTGPIVKKFAANGAEFQLDFAKAMVKLGSIDVIVGKGGQVRKNCRAFN